MSSRLIYNAFRYGLIHRTYFHNSFRQLVEGKRLLSKLPAVELAARLKEVEPAGESRQMRYLAVMRIIQEKPPGWMETFQSEVADFESFFDFGSVASDENVRWSASQRLFFIEWIDQHITERTPYKWKSPIQKLLMDLKPNWVSFSDKKIWKAVWEKGLLRPRKKALHDLYTRWRKGVLTESDMELLDRLQLSLRELHNQISSSDLDDEEKESVVRVCLRYTNPSDYKYVWELWAEDDVPESVLAVMRPPERKTEPPKAKFRLFVDVSLSMEAHKEDLADFLTYIGKEVDVTEILVFNGRPEYQMQLPTSIPIRHVPSIWEEAREEETVLVITDSEEIRIQERKMRKHKKSTKMAIWILQNVPNLPCRHERFVYVYGPLKKGGQDIITYLQEKK